MRPSWTRSLRGNPAHGSRPRSPSTRAVRTSWPIPCRTSSAGPRCFPRPAIARPPVASPDTARLLEEARYALENLRGWWPDGKIEAREAWLKQAERSVAALAAGVGEARPPEAVRALAARWEADADDYERRAL